MTKCTSEPIRFPGCKGRIVDAIFSGQTMTSDGGGLLLNTADRLLGLTHRIAKTFTDNRRKASCTHTMEALLKQRIFALPFGYKDLNDHNKLKRVPVLQTALGRDVEIASAATLCRLENSVDKKVTLGAEQHTC